VPHDSHLSPASFYIEKRTRARPISLKPLVHNEGYIGNFDLKHSDWNQIKGIWNLKHHEMEEYFMQGDQLVMLAPAVRVAEQGEILSALSVSTGTAKSINGQAGKLRAPLGIDFFDRVAGLDNFLGNESRPHMSALLKKGTEAELHEEGIVHPEVIRQFKEHGFSFTENGEDAVVLAEKARAKKALQLNFGMEVDPNKPLFVSFARLVHQKGMEFVAHNVEHILNRGGQILVGGPVGDAVGAVERELFLKIKDRLIREGNPNARNFVFIDGAVRGRSKGLALAGSDFFLIPSRYEPCGLTDCEALFNGTIPIAHHTGGLDKGRETILYRPLHPDDQGWQLGQAINEGFDRYSNQKTFQESQIRAMKEDFSPEKNFSTFLSHQRLEVFGKIIRELDASVSASRLTQEEARQILKQEVLDSHRSDHDDWIRALKMIHPSRRTPLMDWLISTE
jgi:glycogen synthase